MNYIITFILFVVFLFCQYAIYVCSTVIADWFGVTGQVYWCVVVIAFLILNNWCFGAYELDLGMDSEDEWDVEL